jgi:NAD(P)-dependent dehydrogenase (short-subunit alcohol dehydrogenase family)
MTALLHVPKMGQRTESALVTGAGSAHGIGIAIARCLATSGLTSP